MLRGIYSPTDFESLDKDPNYNPKEKLALVEQSAVHMWPSVINNVPYEDHFYVSLPFVVGGTFSCGLPESPEVLFTDYINVGDEALYGNGIGTRLVQAGIRQAVSLDERVTELHTGWARLGLVNTIVRVLGEENVSFYKGGNRYGWGGDNALDTVFDDFPAELNETYLVYKIVAKINRDDAMTWDPPVRVIETNDQLEV